MVTSTVICGAWYEPSHRQLELLFTSGRRYVYSGVPMTVAQGFAEAESKGQYYNAEIRSRFACRRIGGGRKNRRVA